MLAFLFPSTLENPDGPITKYTAENGLSAMFEIEIDETSGDRYYDNKYYIKDINFLKMSCKNILFYCVF